MSTPKEPLPLTQLERHQICATGAIGDAALRKYLRGKPVRDLTKVRLRVAVAALKLEHKFPGLFTGTTGSIPDADPRKVIDEDDADDEATAVAV